jgi:hypothetical protein
MVMGELIRSRVQVGLLDVAGKHGRHVLIGDHLRSDCIEAAPAQFRRAATQPGQTVCPESHDGESMADALNSGSGMELKQSMQAEHPG